MSSEHKQLIAIADYVDEQIAAFRANRTLETFNATLANVGERVNQIYDNGQDGGFVLGSVLGNIVDDLESYLSLESFLSVEMGEGGEEVANEA